MERGDGCVLFRVLTEGDVNSLFHNIYIELYNAVRCIVTLIIIMYFTIR